jgi:hypothetical protein
MDMLISVEGFEVRLHPPLPGGDLWSIEMDHGRGHVSEAGMIRVFEVLKSYVAFYREQGSRTPPVPRTAFYSIFDFSRMPL